MLPDGLSCVLMAATAGQSLYLQGAEFTDVVNFSQDNLASVRSLGARVVSSQQ